MRGPAGTDCGLPVNEALLGCGACRDAFDAVYGSSAGAINATYFLSGQREGVNIYCEDIANRRFVDLRRLVPRRGERATSMAHTHACMADTRWALRVWSGVSGQCCRVWVTFYVCTVWHCRSTAGGVMDHTASVVSASLCKTTAMASPMQD